MSAPLGIETARTLLCDMADATRSSDALDALAWIESGMPDDKVGHGPDAPQFMPEQLEGLAPAFYVPVSESEAVSIWRRAAQGK